MNNKFLLNEEYNFLRDNEYLGENIALLGYGGSIAYGTNIATSDIDVRGVALNSKREVLLGKDFEQVVDTKTDTTIYSLKKIITLLSSCNPNTIEMLGMKPEHYIYLTDVGEALIDNRHMFLSKRAINTFAGYANAQLRRLENATSRTLSVERQMQHVLRIIDNMDEYLHEKYGISKNDVRLYIDYPDNANHSDECAIFADVSLKNYPLSKYIALIEELNNVLRSFNKLGMRNSKALEHHKLGKHMTHLVRLYLMGIDILESEEIVTFREKEHDLLMDIRLEKYLTEDKQPTKEFVEIVNDLEKRMKYAGENTSLPEKPDIKKIEDFMYEVNEKICKN